jgi:hypothetical protein
MSGTPDPAVKAAPDIYVASNPFYDTNLPTKPLNEPGIITHFCFINCLKI